MGVPKQPVRHIPKSCRSEYGSLGGRCQGRIREGVQLHDLDGADTPVHGGNTRQGFRIVERGGNFLRPAARAGRVLLEKSNRSKSMALESGVTASSKWLRRKGGGGEGRGLCDGAQEVPWLGR